MSDTRGKGLDEHTGTEQPTPMTVQVDGDILAINCPTYTRIYSKWEAREIDEKRLLLVESESSLSRETPRGLVRVPIETFRDLCVGLAGSRWSGTIVVDTGAGIKKIFYSHGEIVFAASSIIDDRLGEVIYREAKITLDELSDSAAQVTKVQKFGQVLLANQIFTNIQLWQALKLQVRQILRSCFMADDVYAEMQPAFGAAPTEVRFVEDTPQLIDDCFSFGIAFRAFLSRLRADTRIELLFPHEQLAAEHPPGSFVGDLLALIHEKANVQELLNMSKLVDHYTIAALMTLVNSSLAALRPDVESSSKYLPPSGSLVAPLKAQLDSFAYVYSKARKAFVEAKRQIPVGDFKFFASTLNTDGFPALFLDNEGQIAKDSITTMMNQCAGNHNRIRYFSVRVESMIQYVLQVAGDNLDFAVAKKLRQEYRAISG